MFHFVLSMIGDIITSLQLTEQLHFMAVIVVLMLFSSPGAVATILAVGAKLGVISYIREEKKHQKEAA